MVLMFDKDGQLKPAKDVEIDTSDLDDTMEELEEAVEELRKYGRERGKTVAQLGGPKSGLMASRRSSSISRFKK